MNEPKITIDFETRSRSNLLKEGSYKYSQDPSTDVLMISIILPGGDPEAPFLWYNTEVLGEYGIKNHPRDEEALEKMFELLEQGSLIEAHNAGFEIDIWNNICEPRMFWPKVPIEQWRCSAAKGAYYALPRSLDDLAKALAIKDPWGKPVEKDAEGYKLMLLLSAPNSKTGEFPGDYKQFKRLGEYCRTDTRTEHYCSEVLPDLPPEEQKIWKLDWEINNRGVLCNREMVEKATTIAEEFQAQFEARLPELTGGLVERPTQRQRIRKWVLEQGVDIPNTQATTIEKVLKEGNVPSHVEEVLTILVQGTRTSTAKYRAMTQAICADDRIRGMTMYHGATTGRWSGKGVQPHNFPRGNLTDDARSEEAKNQIMVQAVQDILAGLDWLKLMYQDVGKLLSDALRGAWRASGRKKLVVADFSSIEARVTAWQSGQENLLELFREGGLVYEDMAEKIFHRPIDRHKDPFERFIGKQAILGLGFQMGWKKFRDTLRDSFNTLVTAEFAKKVVKIYRQENDKIVAMWSELEKGAIEAVQTGRPVTTGKVTWYTQRMGDVGIFLRCRLPSGRSLSYPYPMLKKTAVYFFEATEETVDSDGEIVTDSISIRVSVPRSGNQEAVAIREAKRIAREQEYKLDYTQWVGGMRHKDDMNLTFMGVDSLTRQWKRQDTYGGKLMENIVQAIARDFLAYAMLRVDAQEHYDIILTVHDEVVTESPIDKGSYKELEQLLNEVEEWGEGCPIASEGWEGPVYRK